MMKFPDISEYYVNDLAVREEQDWNITKQYKTYADAVNKVIRDRNIKNILEIGCGTGWIPTELPDDVNYLGIDKNPTFLEWAKNKNKPERTFILEDIRNVTVDWLRDFRPDAVICFAVLKHFGLDEWDSIVSRILSLAPLAILEMQIAEHDIDDGQEFHHTFVTQNHMNNVVSFADHCYLYENVIFETHSGYPFQFKSKILVSSKN